MFCPNCGRQIPDGSKFCPYCGEKIVEVAGETFLKQTKEKSSTGRRKPKKKLLIITLVAVFVIAVLFVSMYSYIAPILFKGISNSYTEKAIQEISSTQPSTTPEKSISSAVNNLNIAVKLNPKNIEARESLAAIDAINGDMGEVENQVNNILKLDPNDEYAKLLKSLLSEEGKP
ncbi:zinc-ribbon domain-containing protein [Caldisericum sp.]|jgi:cytochrome c-type biogenesis protein CcmH/NrfG|uniref:zinc-ribbon domain-containing protein n=1 Tax=Caldisericum sp. TaxID=2499687 RepID=UPI003D0EB3D6